MWGTKVALALLVSAAAVSTPLIAGDGLAADPESACVESSASDPSVKVDFLYCASIATGIVQRLTPR